MSTLRFASRRELVRGNPVLLASAMLIVGLLVIMPPMMGGLASGSWSGALILTGGLAFVLLTTRSLFPATLILVGLAAEALGIFGEGSNLPYAQLLPGVRLTIRDALLLALLPLAIVRLSRRPEPLLFWKPFVAVIGAIVVGLVIGVVADGDLKAPLNALRPLFGYALYPIVASAVDSRRKFSWFITSIVVVAALAVGIQVVEAVQGPLPFLGLPLAAGQAQAGVEVDGRNVPYVWNRAIWHLFISLFLALGCILEWRLVRLSAVIALLGGVGFAIMLQRSWYLFIGVGTLAMLVACRSWARRVRFAGLIGVGLGALTFIAATTADLTESGYGSSFLDVWLGRAASLLSVQQDASYQVRISELTQQWNGVLDSPLLGYGLSSDAQRLTIGLANLDTGAVNTLLMFGFVGTAAFVGLVVCGWWQSLRLVRRLPPSRDRGYALGLLGIWSGVLLGYGLNWDFLTHPFGPWLVVLTLGVHDCLARLSRPPFVAPTADPGLG